MALIYNATFDKNTRKLSFEDKAGNEIYSFTVPERAPAVDDITKPLTFRATQDGSTVTLASDGAPSGAFQTSRDGGNTWVDYKIHTAITLNTGDEVSFRAKSNRTSAQGVTKYFHFKMEGEIEAWHNAMSMYRTNDFATYNTTVAGAFYAMFIRCTSLTKAPVLPATQLAEDCYKSMFSGCTSLVNAPVLPATQLAEDCYSRMFSDCTSLVNAPVLPATQLAKYCYYSMFSDCTSLVNAPVLPATQLAEDCYYSLFSGCTSLVNAPVLPATTLAKYCYSRMFKDCSSLHEVHCNMPSSYSSSDVASYADEWLSNVSSTGTFYTNADAKWTTNSASGIPSGWTRRDINLLNALTLTATADNSSVKLTKNGTLDNTFEVDTGNGWTAYEFDTVIPLNAGQSCKWRCSAHPTTQSNSNYVKFVMTGTIEASGNVNSMLLGGFENLTSLSGYDYAFYRLFSGCSSLTKAPNLPATTLASYCYRAMFTDCSSLTEAPNLPATTIASYCYEGLFTGCSSLTKAPNLPATTLRNYCYAYMFRDCTSLTQAPQLPATTLASYCYEGLFFCCSSLTQAPQLPATTLAKFCYKGLFYGCIALTKAPDLPVTTLTDACYGSMFSGCSALTKAPNLPATTLASNCYRSMFENCHALAEVRIAATTTAPDALYRWLQSVADSGTVYAVPGFKDLPTNNVSGIPSGWTRLNIADYPVTP